MQYVWAYLGAGAAFLALDLLWLGGVAKGFYSRQMGDLMAPSVNVPAAFVFYAMYLAGILLFAIAPALNAGNFTEALGRGALFGLFCYGTYDLTNLAVVRGYPARLAIVDMAWGVFLTAMASLAGYVAATNL